MWAEYPIDVFEKDEIFDTSMRMYIVSLQLW